MTDDRHRRDDERALTLALFRYGLVADLAEREDFGPGERTARIRELASQTHYRPGHGPVKVSERTLYAWLAAFREGGLTALLPLRRKDLGTRRVLSDEVIQRAVQLRKEQAKRTTRTLLDILRLEDLLSAEAMPHRSTLDRHLALLGASRRQLLRRSPRGMARRSLTGTGRVPAMAFPPCSHPGPDPQRTPDIGVPA